MFFSFELPTKYLEEFYPEQDHLFCIAPQALEDSTYLDFYKEKSKEKYVILDNGAFELGKSIPFKDLIALAKEIGAKEIVAPDIVHDCPGTIKYVTDLFVYLDEKNLINDYNIMVVPQGKTMEEILNCYNKLARFPTKIIGVPARVLPVKAQYHSEQLRFTFLQTLAKNGLLKKRYVHLLGLCAVQFVKAYRKGQRFFRVRSIDTSFPVVLGMIGKTFEQTKKKPTMRLVYDVSLSKSTIQKIHHNIKWLKEYK